MRMRTFEKYYCMKCQSSQWMRQLPDETAKDKDGFKCIICGTIHKLEHLWKTPPKTIS